MELPAEVSSSVAGSGLDGKSATNGTLGGGLEVTGSGCDVLSMVIDSGTGSSLAASLHNVLQRCRPPLLQFTSSQSIFL